MGVFEDLRESLATDLSAISGLTVHPAWPDLFTPPCAFITPPLMEDWVTRGNFGGEFVVVLEVVFIVEHGQASRALADLEELVAAALPLVETWALHGVDPPSPTKVTDDGAEYLASVIRVSRAVNLAAE